MAKAQADEHDASPAARHGAYGVRAEPAAAPDHGFRLTVVQKPSGADRAHETAADKPALLAVDTSPRLQESCDQR